MVENFGQIGKFYSGCPQVQVLSHMKESMLTRTTLEALPAALSVGQKMEYFFIHKLPLNK